MIIASQRHLFDLPRDCIYLNAAYLTPYTHDMEKISHQAVKSLKQPWLSSAEGFFGESEQTRREMAALLGVDVNTLAFAPSASYGAATAARNMPVVAGQSILLLEGQFPSNVYEWQSMAKEKDLTVRFVKTPNDDDWTSAVLQEIAALGEGLAFAALPNVHWSNGALIDLLVVSQALKKQGAGLVLDLTQSLGAMETDITAIDPDFMFSAGYKWLFGPYSTAILYVAPRHLAGHALEQNWISRQGSEDFARLVHYTDQYQAGARRFDVGERSNFMLMPLVREATHLLANWGVGNVAESCAALTGAFADIFEAEGYRCIAKSHRAPHILGVHVGLQAGERIIAELKEKGVVMSLRGDTLRLSPHLWVDEEDIHRFGKLLAAVPK